MLKRIIIKRIDQMKNNRNIRWIIWGAGDYGIKLYQQMKNSCINNFSIYDLDYEKVYFYKEKISLH